MADRPQLQAASQAVALCTRAATRALERADSPQVLLGVLEALLDLLVRADADEAARTSAMERLGCQAMQHTAQHAGWQAVHASFTAHQAAGLASAVLQEAAMSNPEQHQQATALVRELFAALPAPAALAALIGHLSLLEPAAGRQGSQRVMQQPVGDSAIVQVPGSDVAAMLLAERFAADASSGVQELVAYFAQQQQLVQDTTSIRDGRHGAAGVGGRAWDADEAAGQLASAPERVAHLPNVPRELSGPKFAQHVLSQALRALQQHELQLQQPTMAKELAAALAKDTERMMSHRTASTSAASTSFAEAGPASTTGINCEVKGPCMPGTAFVAALLQRLIARGHGAAAAGTLLHLLKNAGAGPGAVAGVGERCSLQAGITQVLSQLASSHQAATEKVLTEMLVQVSVSGSAPVASVQLLHSLLPSQLLQPGSPAHYLMCEKLLLRRTLPANALQLLLSFLDTASPSLLPAAALTLAQAWADPQAVLHTKLPQQAYMAQVLQGCLALLPQAALAVGSSPLLGAVLQGVSARLGSPLPAVRRQGMRVGRALSVRLDPAKPLFEDQGDLGLLREERWPGALAAAAAAGAAASTGNAAAGAAAAAGGAAATGASGGAAASPGPASTTGPTAQQHGNGGTQQATSSAADGGDSRSDEGRVSPPASGRLSATLHRLEEAAAAPDSDDEYVSSDADDEADSIQAYDLHEDLEAESWEAANWQSAREPTAAAGGAAKPVLALRPLAAALRKADDVDAVLDALKRVEVLVRANPEELHTFAPELARSLLHCRAPEWAETEARSPADAPDAQRSRALIALLATAPIEAGDQVLEEVYSPHLDVYQRLLILDSLCGAARELADPRTAPQLELRAGAPQLLQAGRSNLQRVTGGGSRAVAGAAGQGQVDAAQGQQESAGDVSPDGLRQARTRMWGNVALQKRKQGAAAGPRTFRNGFTGVAVRWASALLRECDVRRHGVDLFGRDGLLLGRLLTTLGTFAECTAQTHAAVPLAAGTLELVRAPQVSASEQPFVRRCALLAAAQVVTSLPPARLAAALVGQSSDAQDAVLVERLQWLQTWATGAAAGDGDENCRLLAAAVVSMQAELAAASMAALQTLPPPAEHGLKLGGAGGAPRGQGKSDISIEVPRISHMQLG